jgi:hypothetical protein
MKIDNLYWNLDSNVTDYPNKIKTIYFKKFIQNRKLYTNWVGQISKKFQNDIDWWLTLPTSRNSHLTNIYRTIVALETIKYYSKIKKLKKENTLKFYNHIIKKNSQKNKFNYIKNFFWSIRALLFNTIIFLFINIFVKRKSIKNNIILIDTFLTSSKIKSESQYKNLKKIIQLKKKKNIFFVPSFVVERNIFNIFKAILSVKKNNYIFKEHYINYLDILFAFGHLIRKRKFLVKFDNFKKWNLDIIIQEEIKSNYDFSSSMTSLLNYRFAKKLDVKKINILKTINWFENQTVDRGWNYGFRKYHKKSKILGYQGFLYYGQHMNSIPTSYEEIAKIIPSKIIVIGKAYLDLKKEFYKNIKLKLGPALNYNDLFKKFKKSYKIPLLVVLCGIKSIDLKILEWIKYIIKQNKKIKFVIKPHPIFSVNNNGIINFKKNIDQIKITKETLPSLLKKTSNVVCCGPTGGILESICYKCHLICPILDPFDQMNLNLLKIPKNFYQSIHTKYEFLEIIKKIKKPKNHKNLNKLKSFLFEKISQKNIKVLISNN